MKKFFNIFSGNRNNEENKDQSVNAKRMSAEKGAPKEVSLESEVGPTMEKENEQGARYIKILGFPQEVTESDILNFLVGCKIIGEVVFIGNDEGSRDAIVMLENESELKKALELDATYVSNRYIRIQRTDSEQLDVIDGTLASLPVDRPNADQPQGMTPNSGTGKTPSNGFVKLGGLDWSITAQDIEKFLTGCDITEIVMTHNERGRPTGDAFVCFETLDDVEKALACHKKTLGKRWVAVENIEKEEFITKKKEEAVKGKENNETKSKEDFVRLSGLSWKATEEDIKSFLKDCKIEKIVITRNDHGKPSGNAFIQFENEDDVRKAKTYNKKHLLERWVAVDEVTKEQFLNETKYEEKFNTVANSKKTFFVKLGGLSWSATEDDIKTFLHEVKVNNIIIAKNENGKSTGNAFIKLEDKGDVEKAKSLNKKLINDRWVTVDEIDEDEYNKGTDETEYSPVHVKLTNLPWSASLETIEKFLANGNCKVKTIDILTTVVNGKRRPSGEALVEVKSNLDQIGALTCHGSTMDGRKIGVKRMKKVEME